MRIRLSQLVGLLSALAIFALVGCGDSDPHELASLAPPDAPLFAEVVLRPDDEQAEAITSFADRVAGIDDPGSALIAELDRALAEGDGELDYAEDIEPWLGDRAAVFVRSFEPSEVAGAPPDFAALIDVDDTDAARSFVERAAAADPSPERERSYEGVDYLLAPDDGVAAGIVEDRLVVGTEASFKVAVDAGEGESLAESQEFEERVGALDADPLATVFLDPGAVINAIAAAQGEGVPDAKFLRPLLVGPLSGPLAVGLSATPDAATLELAAPYEGEGEQASGSTLLEALPAGSWLAAAAPDLGPPLAALLDQLDNSGLPGAVSFKRRFEAITGLDPRADVLRWLGDTAVFVQGSSVPGVRAGVIAETDDPDAPRPLLNRLQRLAERDSGARSASPPAGAEHGFQIGIPGLGAGVEAGVVDDRVVAVIGGTIDQALHPPRSLADDERYRAAVAALGEGFSPDLYLQVPGLLDLVEESDPGPDLRAAAPYLEAFQSLIAGTRIESGMVLGRLVVTLAQ